MKKFIYLRIEFSSRTSGPIMSLSWSCQDDYGHSAGRCKLNSAHVHVIAVRANPTQRREKIEPEIDAVSRDSRLAS